MSPLQPDLSHVEPSTSVSLLGRRAKLPPRAAVVRQCLAAGALGYCLIAGTSCSFDSRPNASSPHSSSAAQTMWMPPSAAGRVSKPDAAANPELDGATNTLPADAAQQPRAADAGTRGMAQTGTTDAALPMATGRGPRTPAMDAAVPSRRSSPDAAARDASNVARALDAQAAAKPDAASSNEPAADRCKSGAYTGTFSGSIQLIGLSLSSVTGTVRAELTRDAAGEHLELHNGRVMGVDQDGNRLTCDLSGTVNCATDELEDGKLENGNFHNVGSDGDTPFTGSAQATYSRDPYSLIGTFSVEAQQSSLLTGRGTWSLIRSN